MARGLPRLSQDSAAAAEQFSPASAARTNEWRAANPGLAASQDAAYDIPWWEPWLGIAGVGAAGLALPAIAGAGAGTSAGIGSGYGLGAGTGVGVGTGAGAGASLPIGGVGGAGLLAGTPGVSAAGLFGGGAAATGGAAAGTAASTLPWANTVPIQSVTSGQVAAGAGIPAGGGGFWNRLGREALRQYTGGNQAPKSTTGQLISLAGRGIGALQRGRAEGRLEEANAANRYDYLNLARTRTEYDRAQAELDQRKFGQDLQERSFGNATRAAFLQNARPGGIRIPSELASFQGQGGQHVGDLPQAQRDEIGGSMYRNAITELLDPLQPGTATSGRRMAALPEPDPLSETPSANGFDTFLNYASLFGGALGNPYPATTPVQTQGPGQNTQQQTPQRTPAQTGGQTTDPLRPGYTGDALTPRSSNASVFAPSPASPYMAPTPSTVNAGLSQTAGLPSIADLVRDVPGPNVGTLGPYDPNDPYGRRRGRIT